MLDDLAHISKLDKAHILDSTDYLDEQVKDSWETSRNLKLQGYQTCQNIVVAGMGGSALGGRVVHYLEFQNLRAPLEVVTGYHLPNYTNDKTLVILSSYSGSTEETISSCHDVIVNA